ncbi:MAG TPA: sialidase family protein [Candidatus Thermoplasmatota archaeon]|nr:sialidase family protein [Candidatus Thermoplasmatota archaeon]
MRAILLLVGLVLAAGCFTPAPATQPSPEPSTLGGWTLDCAQGGYEKAMNASWAQPCEARTSHTAGSKSETWIAINPTDVDNVVAGVKDLNPESSPGCVWNGVFVTHDGGRTWKDVVIGGTFADRQPTEPWFGYACNTDPDFQFTSDGALHYGVELYGILGPNGPVDTPLGGVVPGGYKILLATSHDGGDTWPEVITFQPDLLVVTDYSRMTIDPTNDAILEAIGSDGGVGCHVLRSTDGGKTATFVDVQTQYGPPCGSGGNTAIAVSPDGVAVIVGGGLLGPNNAYQPTVVRSTDDGLTWIDANPGFSLKPIPSFKESEYRVGSKVELAYDLTDGPHRGTLYALYDSADRDEADLWLRTSADDGKTWSEGVLVNDDPEGSHQWMGQVAVAGDGSVHAFYMDKRYDPAHVLMDVTHAVSMDGGATWTNERVSALGFDGDKGIHQEGFPFIGDYIGAACVADDCWAAFPDASVTDVPVVAAAHVHRS